MLPASTTTPISATADKTSLAAVDEALRRLEVAAEMNLSDHAPRPASPLTNMDAQAALLATTRTIFRALSLSRAHPLH
ncbi:hypothetical protein C2845_PM11G15800 [Panicum miliaceum]|uniref:Uncharacterized protein n=1 Tax=Panicum miliaceum TaxID=4540 RepID=A0A3L6RUS0_PANMI|nr:hypothetical protein C2845_PM11G15800 [Panicum miliaceum]